MKTTLQSIKDRYNEIDKEIKSYEKELKSLAKKYANDKISTHFFISSSITLSNYINHYTGASVELEEILREYDELKGVI